VTEGALLAEEPAQAEIETLPEAPKATKETTEAELSGDAAGAVIAFAGRVREADTDESPTAARANDLVTVRAKPEKRKNYKERAKAKFAKDDSKEDTVDGTTPDTTATAKSAVIEKAKAEKKAKAKVERQKAKESRKSERQKAKKADGKTGNKTAKAGRKAD
jgi:hypothetical protein